MSEYNGPAELLAGGLLVESVDVHLRHSVDPISDFGSWSGRVRPTPVTGAWFEVDQIRLPDGRVGQVKLDSIKTTRGAGPAQQAANILSSGDPPFDSCLSTGRRSACSRHRSR